MSCVKKTCATCRNCTYIEKRKEFVCHNEESENFGKGLGFSGNETESCADFSSSRGYGKNQMSLVEALEIIVSGSTHERESQKSPKKLVYQFCDYHLPDNDNRPIIAKVFDTNKELDNYRDAMEVVFAEFMRLKFPEETKETGEELE